jgi:Fe2+ or Zn2+ uptake regulation protein
LTGFNPACKVGAVPHDAIDQTLTRLKQLRYRVTRPPRCVARALGEADDMLRPEAVLAPRSPALRLPDLVTVYRSLALPL